MARAGMRATPGDRLVIDGDPDRVGVVIGVPHPDGSPPYVVRWHRSGHIALVSPDSYSSLVRADSGRTTAPGSGTEPPDTAAAGTGR